MTVFDILAGLLFGILAGMGIGGGGLIVIYLTLFRDYSQIDAQGANLLFFTVAAAAAMFIHFKKRKISFLPVIILTLSGLAGAFAGSHVTAVIPQGITRKLFGIMLIASGMITAFRASDKKTKILAAKGLSGFRHM